MQINRVRDRIHTRKIEKKQNIGKNEARTVIIYELRDFFLLVGVATGVMPCTIWRTRADCHHQKQYHRARFICVDKQFFFFV